MSLILPQCREGQDYQTHCYNLRSELGTKSQPDVIAYRCVVFVLDSGNGTNEVSTPDVSESV